MRINKYIASGSRLSRRAADDAVSASRVTINGQLATAGSQADGDDIVKLDDVVITPDVKTITVMFHKPVGYVVSRDGQGQPTIYDLLPAEYQQLNPIGRLDMYSSGLLLLTNDGQLANELTHPRYAKIKVYELKLAQPLAPLHRQLINDKGIQLEDGTSQLQIDRLEDGDDRRWRITMHEGRNRQIRRTFLSLGYGITSLQRVQFGNYQLGSLAVGQLQKLMATGKS